MEKKRLLEKITGLAHGAGAEILKVYSRNDFGVTIKEEGSPLTLADRAAHDFILEGLAGITPSIPVISEESKAEPYAIRKAWKRFWIVDPLDGTKEFIKRNGEFTVNIALIEGGEPVLGAVSAPALGVTYYGARGVGAFRLKDGETARISAAGYTGGSLKVVASRSHRDETLEKFLGNIGSAEILSMGSSLKFCLVAEGQADLYPRFGPTMEWDTAAAQCVVECAGGVVTDLAGQALSYNKEDLANPSFIVAGKPPFPWQKFIL